MPNTPITMTKLRTIIRLYEDRTGLKTIAEMSRTSRNTVKKYINRWNSLGMSYEEFQSRSDSELHELFCVNEEQSEPNPRMEALEAMLPSTCKEMGKKGMTSHKQWERYIAAHPDGYGLTQFRLQIRRYQIVSNVWNIRRAIRCLSTTPALSCGSIRREINRIR